MIAKGIIVIALIYACACLAIAGPVISAPSKADLHSLGLCDSEKKQPVIFSNGLATTKQYAFTVFRVECSDRVLYVFWSDVVRDWVDHEFTSIDDVLVFFSVRFKGIANDIAHGRRRPDIESERTTSVDARSKMLLLLAYDGYRVEIEKARASLVKRAAP